jgi:hypothetical protein
MTDEVQELFPHLIAIDELDASAVGGLYAHDITQYPKTAKLTIQKFLEGCMRPDGQLRRFFDRFATFTVDYHVNEKLSKEDRGERHLQISRYFARTAEYPPQIFIQDNGYTYTPASLGGLTYGKNTRTKNGLQMVRVMDVVPLTIDITCAAVDEQQIEDLTAFLTAAFGQYQKFLCNHVLSPQRNSQGVYYEVRIPLTHTVGSKSHTALHQDPRQQMWQQTFSMTVEFENSSYIGYRADPRYVEAKVSSPVIEAPTKVRIYTDVKFSVTKMPYPIRVYSDDSRIAVVSPMQTHYVISPKRLGTFDPYRETDRSDCWIATSIVHSNPFCTGKVVTLWWTSESSRYFYIPTAHTVGGSARRINTC